MLPFASCSVLKRAVSIDSSLRVPCSAQLSRGIVPKATANSITQFRRMCTNSAAPSPRHTYRKKDKSQRISPEVAKQIEEDHKWMKKPQILTGPNSGSARTRKANAKSPRFPEEFMKDLQQVEAHSGPHLESIKKHFLEDLDMKFDDWEMVQSALTHYSYGAARKTNDALSRLGEKALRFVLTTELVKLDPILSKQSWYLTTNLRFLTRFEFLSSYIDATLQVGPLTRYKEPTSRTIKYETSVGREAAQYRQSVVAKSVFALIGVIYKTKGEAETREFVRTLFIDPYKDDNGLFQAPVLQPIQIKQTGRL